MSQRFLNLISNGQTAEVAAAAEEDPSLIACRDAQGVSAFLWSIYSRQPLIRDFLLAHLERWIFLRPARWAIAAALNRCCGRMRCWSMRASADGWAPLHLAAAFGGPQATALLLAHGAHVHRFSRNPLHNQALHACMALSQDCETVRLLIDQGADVNMAQAGGYTPLHQAAAAGRADLVGILLEGRSEPGYALPSG